MFLNDPNGLPTPAGGNGTLVASVGLDGGSTPIVATVVFSSFDSTSDILNAMDLTFASATLPSGASYAGIINGSPVFYTDDLRPLSVGFSYSGNDDLSFLTGAAIYYVPEPASLALLAFGVVGLLMRRRP